MLKPRVIFDRKNKRVSIRAGVTGVITNIADDTEVSQGKRTLLADSSAIELLAGMDDLLLTGSAAIELLVRYCTGDLLLANNT